MSLVTGFLYLIGGAAVLSAGLVELARHESSWPLLTIGVVAMTTGSLVMRWGARLPRSVYHLLVAAGTVLIALASYVAPDAATATALSGIATFVALDAFFYFAWPGALVQLTFVIGLNSWVLGRRPDVPVEAGISLGLVCLGISVVVGALVRRASTAGEDPVTGLANRRGFDEALEHLLRPGARSAEHLAAALLDVDHFKIVNDTQGHDAGDELLRSLARCWRALLPVGAVLARHGGDEFSVLLPDHTGPEAFEVVEQLRRAADIGISCGITGHHRGETASQLMRRADRALYQAKAAGRGRSVLDQHEAPDALVDDMVAALAEAESTLTTSVLDHPGAAGATSGFHLAYQPIVTLTDGAVVGVEALARWTHPTLGSISPARFIPIAEQTGLIRRLGSLVMRRACTDLATLYATSGQQLLLTVNVSGLQLCDPAFPDEVRAVLDETGWSARSTVLEVTESLVDADSPVAVAALTSLRELGIGVAIDDFGTGYSALSRLDTLPSDYLKLDHSFVSEITTSTRRARLMNSIMVLAAALELTVIAEGVETAEQAETLTYLGCVLAQGYHFHAPLPLERLMTALPSRVVG